MLEQSPNSIKCQKNIPLIIIFSSFIVYNCFGINYLIKEYEILNTCDNSSLWELVISSIILSPFLYTHFILKNYSNVNSKNKLKLLGISVIIILFLIVFGSYSLYKYNSECIFGESLWIFGVYSLVFHIIYILYSFISYLDYLLPIEIFEENDIENNIENDIENDIENEFSFSHNIKYKTLV